MSDGMNGAARARLEVRRHGDVFDELVADDAYIHVEVMSQPDPADEPDSYAHVWLRVVTSRGEVVVSFYSDAEIKIVVEQEAVA